MEEKKKHGFLKFLGVLIVLGAIAWGGYTLAIRVVIPTWTCIQAKVLLDRGELDEAISAWESVNGWLNATERLREARYRKAAELSEAGNYEEAYMLYVSLPGYKDVDDIVRNDPNFIHAREARMASFRQVGNIVTFGRYEQDNYTATGQETLEWIVLEVEENRVMLISRYGLDAQPYNTEYDPMTWEQCSLRSWLNDTFFNTAFNAGEQQGILLTHVDNSAEQGYPEWETYSGNDTEDRIYVLSYAEAYHYYGVTYQDLRNVRARAQATEYAKKRGVRTNVTYRTEENMPSARWWLRSPGIYQRSASHVSPQGDLGYYGVDDKVISVRPVLWLDIEAGVF